MGFVVIDDSFDRPAEFVGEVYSQFRTAENCVKTGGFKDSARVICDIGLFDEEPEAAWMSDRNLPDGLISGGISEKYFATTDVPFLVEPSVEFSQMVVDLFEEIGLSDLASRIHELWVQHIHDEDALKRAFKNQRGLRQKGFDGDCVGMPAYNQFLAHPGGGGLVLAHQIKLSGHPLTVFTNDWGHARYQIAWLWMTEAIVSRQAIEEALLAHLKSAHLGDNRPLAISRDGSFAVGGKGGWLTSRFGNVWPELIHALKHL